MENKELKNPMLNELDEDMLDHVSGGYTEDESELWITCGYCSGRIYLRKNKADISREELKCTMCGYMPSDPSTVPSKEDIYGG